MRFPLADLVTGLFRTWPPPDSVPMVGPIGWVEFELKKVFVELGIAGLVLLCDGGGNRAIPSRCLGLRDDRSAFFSPKEPFNRFLPFVEPAS